MRYRLSFEAAKLEHNTMKTMPPKITVKLKKADFLHFQTHATSPILNVSKKEKYESRVDVKGYHFIYWWMELINLGWRYRSSKLAFLSFFSQVGQFTQVCKSCTIQYTVFYSVL